MKSIDVGVQLAPRAFFRGPGIFAGRVPDPTDPESADGRFRVLNVPKAGRIGIYEHGTMVCVAETISAADGTWLVGFLDPDRFFTVIGWDVNGLQNAAIQDWVKPYAE